MKKRNFILVSILSLLMLIFFSACNNSSENKNTDNDTLTTEIDNQLQTDNDTINRSETIEEDADYTSKYVCPMHCEGSGTNEKGNCKVCGMELIENFDYVD